MARRQGATDAELSAIATGTFDGFASPWRSALRLADAMTRSHRKVSDAQFEELSAHWSAEQIVEIVAVVCLFNYFCRFADALDIPVTN